jgi:hypothetical protein
MPRTYTSEEAFREYSGRIKCAIDYESSMGVVSSAFSCLALTNGQIRDLQSLAWEKSKMSRESRKAVMMVRMKNGGSFEIHDRKEADGIKESLKEYEHDFIFGNKRLAEKKRIEMSFHGRIVSVLCSGVLRIEKA